MKTQPIGGLGTALRTLTIIPWPFKESKDLSSSLPWFPFIGLILGLILCLVEFIWVRIVLRDWPEGGSVIILTVQVILTRGLHLDGLADWADAIGGHHERERRLTIMKDSHLGTFGVLALVIVFFIKWVAINGLISTGSFIWLLPVLIISRSMMVELMTTMPYARTGEGMAQPFVRGASTRYRILTHTFCLCSCLFISPAGVALFGMGWMITRLLGISFQRSFGGITGDLLGTNNEIVEMSLLMIVAFPGNHILCYTGWSWLF